MAVIQDLLAKIEDAALRERIAKEVEKLTKQKKFGLVFEEHIPECTPLYGIPIKVGTKVALKGGHANDFSVVVSVEGDSVVCFSKEKNEQVTYKRDELVAVAEFGEPIYPFLKPVASVCNAPDSPLWHTLIEADNYHALQLLEYLYAGKVDCIYIDPPYNTGAKDWKYNNDYVDAADSYRHSKWLSMMEKRLKIAKKLLNPKDSVLIVTIDEKEYLHLGCLLEEMFPEARMQMVTDVINPSGVARKREFSRAEEYVFILYFGDANVCSGTSDMLHPDEGATEVRWASLLRSGNNSAREARPNLFYPIFFSNKDGNFIGTGLSLHIKQDKNEVSIPNEAFAMWPIKNNGNDATWTLSQNTFAEKLRKGYVKFGRWSIGSNFRSISYLAEGTERAIRNGELEVLGIDENGTVILGNYNKTITPLTVWNQSSHSAGDNGSSMLLRIFNDKRFNFPKSLYATHDTIRFFVANKPNALIVDFFAGSGTTLHAVNLLNAEDGGRRRCILVTNNEVSVEEAKRLTEQGYKPGDEEWERLGIAQYVTWPRTVCSIEGHDVNGNPLKGNYLGTDLPMKEGFKANAIYFKLGFLDKTAVALGRQFRELLPTLWMKSGAVGPCPTIDGDVVLQMLVLEENQFAVLIDEGAFPEFAERMAEHPDVKTIYFVTDSEDMYKRMRANYNAANTYQLYRDYLDNFRINVRR